MVSTGQKGKVGENSNDINSLPDDILISILSRLSLKESAATSILAKRWIDLWLNISRLDFERDMGILSYELESQKEFINWVNSVMIKYKRRKLDFLRICFNLDDSLGGDIDDWFIFASNLRVKILELDFLQLHSNDYYFPHINPKPCLLNTFDLLETLSLKYVKMSEEALECLLARCPLLESLSLCGELGNLKFSGLALKLKYLEIMLFTRSTIEISNINLVSFIFMTFRGPWSDLIIKDVPKLENISILVPILESMFFDMILSCRGLRSLVVDLDLSMNVRELRVSSDTHISEFVFPEFLYIEELTLVVTVRGNENLLAFISLVNACPNLISFVLELKWQFPFSPKMEKVKQTPKYVHSHLKSVEIKGYYGYTSCTELASYFLQNAINLEKMVIDPRKQDVVPERKEYNKYRFVLGRPLRLLDDITLGKVFGPNNVGSLSEIEVAEKQGRNHAKRFLTSKKPSTVQLMIL